MDRLTGFRTFLGVVLIVMAVLRGVHVGIPLVFPNTRSGPFEPATLDDAVREAGFPPLIPAYRPATLGERPARLVVSFSPRPTFVIEWRQGDEDLVVTEREGGPRPWIAPLAQPLDEVPGAFWWIDGPRGHVVVRRGDLWVEIETTLPPRDLRRFVDTLTPAR